MEVLYRAIKQLESQDPITFEEFSKGVMDFPFLLEQFQQELEELSPAERSGKRDGLLIEIESIEEEDELTPKNSRNGPVNPATRVFTFPTYSSPGDLKQLLAAYSLFANISKQSFESVPAPTPLAGPSDQADVTLTELVEMILISLSKIQARYQRTEFGQIVSGLTEGAKLLSLQLESCGKEIQEQGFNYQQELEFAAARAAEMDRRCQMAETSYTLLFDKLKTMEEEVKLAYSHREESQMETFHLRDLLKSEQAQGQIVSSELEEIQQEIAAKEEQIEFLQRSVRRLNSRKVLHELPADNFAVQELRAVRKERRSSGSVYLVRDKITGKPSPVISPTSARLSVARGSDTRQLTILNAMLSEKQKQIKSDTKTLQDRERHLEQWEFQLKCRETDLESATSISTEQLRSELEATRKRLFSEQNKVTQLELALNETRQSMHSRLDVTTEGYESLAALKDAEWRPIEKTLSLCRAGEAEVVGRKQIKDTFEPKKKEGCCGFF